MTAAATSSLGDLVRRSGPAALVALAVGAAVFHARLFSVESMADERIYAAAVRAAAASEAMPSGWYYPDITARLGGMLHGAGVPMAPLLGLLRLGNLLGTALVVGTAAAAVPRRWGLPLAGLAVALWAPAAAGISAGNVSGLLYGLVLLAAVARPAPLRGALLLAGFPLKPTALAVALSRGPIIGGLAAVAALLAVLDTSGRSQMSNLLSPSNASPARAIAELGIPLPWQVWTGVALVLAATWAKESWGRALCCAWASLPLSWEHAAVGLLPVAALAWLRASGEPLQSHRTLHRALVALAVLVLHQSHLWGLADGPAWLSGLMGLAPTAAVVWLGLRQPLAAPSSPT